MLFPSGNPFKHHAETLSLQSMKQYIIIIVNTMLDVVLLQHCFCFVFNVFVWCPCMAINVSVQYNGGLLPDMMLLTQCYYHRGSRLNTVKRFCIYLQPIMIPPTTRFNIFPPDWAITLSKVLHRVFFY